MCGVLAIYSQGRIEDRHEKAALLMLDSMARRGPDISRKIKVNDRLLLGHTRLRVASLSPAADQPKSYVKRDLHISFNGEIFNQADLKKQLGGALSAVPDLSEAEIILALYEKYGQGCFARLEGQFALILYDGAQDRLILARDPFGICPLYYMAHGGTHYMASSVRAIVGALSEFSFSPDPQAVDQFLLLRYVLAPKTIVKEIQQVCPGEVVIFEQQQSVRKRYWMIGEDLSYNHREEGDVVERLVGQLQQSINGNCQAGSDVGLFLSGGLDSTIILSGASKWRPGLALLNLDMGAAEENRAARLAADYYNSQLTSVTLPHQRPEVLLDNMMAAMDHPTAARDGLATFALAQALKSRFPAAKAVLTGSGADELFSGYRSSYFAPCKKRDMRGTIQNMLVNYSTIHKSRPITAVHLAANPIDVDRVTDDISRIMRAACPAADDLSADARQNLFYMSTHLPGWELAINDMMCMFFGREPRVPFLTKSICRLAFSLPDDLRYRDGTEKYILRQGFGNILPPEIVMRRKLPLSRPMAQWMWTSGLSRRLSQSGFRDRGILNLDIVGQLDCDEDFDLLWRVYIVEKWFQQCLD